MGTDVDYSILPEHMQQGAREYVELRREPGGFLQAVLENDLVGAFGRADADNYVSMHLWARWLFNEAPLDCWGSPAKVAAWLTEPYLYRRMRDEHRREEASLGLA